VWPRTILVTDGEERAALATVRSLGRAGHRVLVCSRQAGSIAGGSRFAASEHAIASPLTHSREFSEAVRRLVTEMGIDSVIPISEASLLALLPLRDELQGVLIPFASLTSFRGVSDKQRLLEAAREAGISIPEQTAIASRDDCTDLDADTLHYPVVLKPARSVVGEEGEREKVGVKHAADAAALRERLAAFPDEAFPILIQQRIVGPGVGVFLLLWDGQVLAEFAHRRLREKPPSGGVSVYRESIPADPELVARSRALLEHFDWRGVAMVEYKVDEATGIPYLMEINGRFWGSLQLAIDAGVDFPALLVAAASDQNPTPVRSYRSGVRSRWWWGDVDQLLLRLRRSDKELSLPPGSPGRARALMDFFTLWRPGDRNEIFRLDDPRPLVRETLEWFRSLKR
jgi:predicted ATP-grasp superfamily ATP-dependent carboligase